MTITAAEPDPYLLPLPGPGTPVVLPGRAGAMHAHLNGRYADPEWPLAPLTDNPSAFKPAINWRSWPASFTDEMRLAAWNLINGQLRPLFLQQHGPRMRGRISCGYALHDGGELEAARPVARGQGNPQPR